MRGETSEIPGKMSLVRGFVCGVFSDVHRYSLSPHSGASSISVAVAAAEGIRSNSDAPSKVYGTVGC